MSGRGLRRRPPGRATRTARTAHTALAVRLGRLVRAQGAPADLAAQVAQVIRVEKVARIEVGADGRQRSENASCPYLQIDDLHPSFRVTLTGGDSLWRRRVDASEIRLG